MRAVVEYSQAHNSYFCPPVHLKGTGRIQRWQLDVDAWQKPRRIRLRQTGTASVNLCVENKSILHMKGRISMVSPGAGPGCHGSGRHWWKRREGDQRDWQEDSVIHLRTPPYRTSAWEWNMLFPNVRSGFAKDSRGFCLGSCTNCVIVEVELFLMIANDPSIHPDDAVPALIAFTVRLNVNGVSLSCVRGTIGDSVEQ